METAVKEATTAEVKEATTEVVDKLRPKKAPWVSLREVLCSEGFDDKRGGRRVLTLWGAINAPFCRYIKKKPQELSVKQATTAGEKRESRLAHDEPKAEGDPRRGDPRRDRWWQPRR
jgi:hypothetical protein